MLRQMEGARAVAEAVALSRPEGICAYPNTPQTHIVEALGAKVKARVRASWIWSAAAVWRPPCLRSGRWAPGDTESSPHPPPWAAWIVDPDDS